MGVDGLTVINNCLNLGKFVASSNYVGNIAGTIGGSSGTSIVRCYWIDTGCNAIFGRQEGSLTVSGTTSATMSTTTMNNLNYYVTPANGWNEWTYNSNSKNIKFVVHDGEGFTFTSSQMILLPRPERRGYAFLFWCMNKNSTSCNNKYKPTTTLTAATTLYAQWSSQTALCHTT